MKPIIEINGLSCTYGGKQAVRDITLSVPEGSIYAFLGTNGAGKTTTIRTLMNLLKPKKGTTKIFDVPSSQLGPKELAQIGYLSENQSLPESLTVQELIEYSRAIYPTWDDALCDKLSGILALPLNQKLSQFSRGMKIKAAFLISLAYRPRLLVLDEPFSGLDPLVRDELIQSLLVLFEQENWTMFVSSHDIDEVERLADWVGILDRGRLCLSEPIETLRARFRRTDVTLPEGEFFKNTLPELGLLFEATEGSARWTDNHFINDDTTAEQVRKYFPQGTAFTTTALSLREIFVAATRALRLNSQAIL
ncbi:MAG: ABC transporter ATP-binding protein [Chthoniobacterales bacterium]